MSADNASSVNTSSGAVSTPPAEARCWSDVIDRNAEADGYFWYGVATTGIYCRPSCPSRTPRRENVRFFTSTAAAEAAGFRACKRCQPDDALTDRNTRAIIRACRLIMNDGAPELDRIATEIGMSRFHFQRTFKRLTGITPKAFADALRAGRLREALTAASTITDAIFAAGFNSSGRFYAAADAMLGMSAKNFRAGAEGLKIRFGIGQSTLGAILVAATGRGVCSILLGDDPETLLRDLQQRFPRAELLGGDAEFEQWMAGVIGFVEAPKTLLALPLDIRGTVFQQRVWQALQEIPPGHTASYGDIAARIGEPKAARAVARACAANPVAVAIPCHRVVRQDGSLSGYRWGVERKRALLAREAPGTTDAAPHRTGD